MDESFFPAKLEELRKQSGFINFPHRRLRSNMIMMKTKSLDLLSDFIKIIIQRDCEQNYQEIVIPKNN